MISRLLARLFRIDRLDYPDYVDAVEQVADAYADSLRRRDFQGLRDAFYRLKHFTPVDLGFRELHLRVMDLVRWQWLALTTDYDPIFDESQGPFPRAAALSRASVRLEERKKAEERAKLEYVKLGSPTELGSVELFWRTIEELARERR